MWIRQRCLHKLEKKERGLFAKLEYTEYSIHYLRLTALIVVFGDLIPDGHILPGTVHLYAW